MPPYDKRPIQDRFWSFVDRTSHCWLWKGATNGRAGYGIFYVTHGVRRAAHRFSYELANGALGDGLHVCHACDTPSCVNPSHLFAGSHADNMRDCFAKGRNPGNRYGDRACCKHGHPYGENPPRRPDRGRRCLTCERARPRSPRRRRQRGQVLDELAQRAA
jgi:hypothetical protein